MAKKADFLSNKPLGEDLFDGQSQDKVAMAQGIRGRFFFV